MPLKQGEEVILLVRPRANLRHYLPTGLRSFEATLQTKPHCNRQFNEPHASSTATHAPPLLDVSAVLPMMKSIGGIYCLLSFRLELSPSRASLQLTEHRPPALSHPVLRLPLPIRLRHRIERFRNGAI